MTREQKVKLKYKEAYIQAIRDKYELDAEAHINADKLVEKDVSKYHEVLDDNQRAWYERCKTIIKEYEAEKQKEWDNYINSRDNK